MVERFGRATGYTVKDALTMCNQLSIWRDCLDLNVDIGDHFCNPLRPDNNPACSLWVGDTGKVYLNDFADQRFHFWDIFEVVKYVYQISNFQDTIDFIVNFYGSGDNITVDRMPSESVSRSDIVFMPRLFEDQIKFIVEDKIYWSPFEITSPQLLEDFVYPVEVMNVFSPRKNKIVQSYPVFAYAETFPSGHVKICQPYLKRFKWISNVDEWDIRGLEDLPQEGDILVVNKSYKDWRIQKNQGYNCISTINEGVPFPKEVILDLASRFKRIYLFFDNDETGLKELDRLVELYNKVGGNWIPLYIPKFLNVKDNGEFITTHGRVALCQWFKKTII